METGNSDDESEMDNILKKNPSIKSFGDGLQVPGWRNSNDTLEIREKDDVREKIYTTYCLTEHVDTTNDKTYEEAKEENVEY